MGRRVFAIAAHPDDIEFMMSGTLLLLAEQGYEPHCMTVANGSCGSMELPPDEIAVIRGRETLDAAKVAGAVYHESLVDDIEIFYTSDLLKRVAAVVRDVAPDIILTHSPNEYMEDHSITCRLTVTAAFTRGMPNYSASPPTPHTEKAVALYHALPYGLRDPLNRTVTPGLYVDVSTVMERKRAMLACHRSQKEWLDQTQGIDSYLTTMETMCRQVGTMSGHFSHAEGWTRHLPLGLSPEAYDPLRRALGANVIDAN